MSSGPAPEPTTQSTTEATTEATTEPTTGPGAGPVRVWWQRRRWPILVGALAVLVVLVGALGLPRTTQDFDPDSAAPDGTRALVRVLATAGVQVEVVRSIDDVDPAPDATLLVSRPGLVPFTALSDLTRSGDLVLIEPDAVVLDELGVPATPVGPVSEDVRAPVCDQPDAVVADRVLAGGTGYRSTGAPADLTTSVWLCYPDAEPDDDRPARGSLVVTETAAGRVSVVGQPDLMRNAHLAEHGNAALAVRLLGHQPRLQWYVPDPNELPLQDEVSPADLMPDWARWLPWQLALATLVAMVWRGRRLGALVPEPLPVVVRSAETQEGRARLYRRAGARDRAAAALRTATLRRLAERLQATHTSPADLAERVAANSGRDPAGVRQTLIGGVPADDEELVSLANRLSQIEKDVAATASGRGPGEREDRG